jgi:hypothetical protein
VASLVPDAGEQVKDSEQRAHCPTQDEEDDGRQVASDHSFLISPI